MRSDLTRTVFIADASTVIQAITRQLLHYFGHVEPIVLLAKHFRGPDLKSLSIPRGKPGTCGRDFEPIHAGNRKPGRWLRPNRPLILTNATSGRDQMGSMDFGLPGSEGVPAP